MNNKRVVTNFFRMTSEVSVVGTTHPHVFAEGTPAGKDMAELQEKHLEYVTLTTQGLDVAIRMSIASKARIKDDLVATMETVSKLAKHVGRDEFFLPQTRNVETLITAASSWINRAELRQVLVENGYGEYMDKLKDLVSKMTEALHGKSSSANERTEVSEAVEKLYRATRKVFHRLDAVVRLQFREDSPVLAVWKRATRIGRSQANKQAAETETQPEAKASPPENVAVEAT